MMRAIRSSSTSDSFGLAVRQVNIWRPEKFDELFSNKKIFKGYQFKIYLAGALFNIKNQTKKYKINVLSNISSV